MKQVRSIILYIGISLILTGCPLSDDDDDDEVDRDITLDSSQTDDTDHIGYDSDDWSADSNGSADTDTGPMELVEEHIVSYLGEAVNGVACWDDKVAWQHRDADGLSIALWDANSKATTHTDSYTYGNDVVVMSSDLVAWETNYFDGLPYTGMDISYMSSDGDSPGFHQQTEQNETGVRVDGNNVIYQHYNGNGTDLIAGTLGDAGKILVPDMAPREDQYDIWEDLVVYVDLNGDIVVENLENGELNNLGPGEGNVNSLRISGNYIAYYLISGFGETFIPVVMDITTKELWNIAYGIPTAPSSMDIDGNYVAYVGTDIDAGNETSSVHVYNIEAKKMRRATNYIDNSVWGFDMGGGRICWYTSSEYLISDWTLNPWDIYTAKLP